MFSLASLWLPIILSTIGVFFASSFIWMALPIHKNDYKKLGAKEPEVMGAVRSWGLGAGMFMFPYCDPKDRNDPAMKQKIKDGPWGTMSLMAKPWSMGQMLGLWLVNLLIISTLIGYIGANTLPAGTAFAHVTRIVGTAALLAYGGSSLTDSIWKGRPWSVMPGVVFDAVVYAAVTAVVFGLLWPKGM